LALRAHCLTSGFALGWVRAGDGISLARCWVEEDQVQTKVAVDGKNKYKYAD